MPRTLNQEIELLKEAIKKNEDCYLVKIGSDWRLVTDEEFQWILKPRSNSMSHLYYQIIYIFQVKRILAEKPDTNLSDIILEHNLRSQTYLDNYTTCLVRDYEEISKVRKFIK